ncbi:MAG: GIY-YIG nuclease family protein [Pseudomonadota bacterium]
MRQPCVYLLASKKNGTLYCGVTMNLPARLEDHQTKSNPDSFTAKYGVDRLVWFQDFDDMASAIQREKSVKKYPRQWKINLIEAMNPDWLPLCPMTGMIVR